MSERTLGGYGDRGFQATTIVFPSEGCWEVTGSVGDASLTFVTLAVKVEDSSYPPTALLLQRNEAEGRYELPPIDATTGREVAGREPMVAGESAVFSFAKAFSPNGVKLAAIGSRGQVCENRVGGASCRPKSDVLHLIDLRDWSEVTATLPGEGSVTLVAFSPDSTRVTLVFNERKKSVYEGPASSTLMVFDASTGQVVSRRALDFRPSMLEYTPDGAELVVYGVSEGPIQGISRPGPPRLVLMDPDDLKVNWEISLANIVSGSWCVENCEESYQYMAFVDWRPAVVHSRYRRRLHIVHPDGDRLTTVDIAGRSVLESGIRAARTWPERLLDLTAAVAEAKPASAGAAKTAAVSPNGRRLYVVGRRTDPTRGEGGGLQKAEEPIGLQIVDAESGRIIDTRDIEATGVRFTPDGAYLILDSARGSEWTEVLDGESLATVASLTEWEVHATRDLEGRLIVLASQFENEITRFAILDPQTFEVVHSWSVDGLAVWVIP